MKRFLPMLIIVVLLVSMIGVTVAFAGASISGSTSVLAGKSYTYKGSASYSAGDLIGKIEGLGQTASFGEMAGGLVNESLKGTASITVTIPSTAKPGDTYSITLSGFYSDMNPDGSGSSTSKSFSTSITLKVVEKAPAATRDPNATPKPLEGWQIADADVEAAEPGAVVEVVMTDDYNIPESLLEKAIENKNILHIDFGTYTCTIDPTKLTDVDGIKKLNLKLEFEKTEGLTEIAGGKDVYQLHFGHDGELPGLISFTFKATENKPGDTVYLYYYYGVSGIVEGITSAVVDENGMVTFDIYHCSSYFVTAEVLEGAQSNFDTESKVQIEELTTSLGETQTELDNAKTQISALTEQNTALEEDLAASQQEASELKEMAEKALIEPEVQSTEFSLVVLIAAVAAAAMLSILLTMLITKSGLFRRSEKAVAGYEGIRYQPEQAFKEEPEESWNQEPEEEPEQEPEEENKPEQ